LHAPPWKSSSTITSTPANHGHVQALHAGISPMVNSSPCQSHLSPGQASPWISSNNCHHLAGTMPSRSNRGSEFTSKFWRSLAGLLDIKMDYSTAYHPETDGQTERTNQTLEQHLRIYGTYNQDDWVEKYWWFVFCYEPVRTGPQYNLAVCKHPRQGSVVTLSKVNSLSKK
jgi:hypothetical protein